MGAHGGGQMDRRAPHHHAPPPPPRQQRASLGSRGLKADVRACAWRAASRASAAQARAPALQAAERAALIAALGFRSKGARAGGGPAAEMKETGLAATPNKLRRRQPPGKCQPVNRPTPGGEPAPALHPIIFAACHGFILTTSWPHWPRRPGSDDLPAPLPGRGGGSHRIPEAHGWVVLRCSRLPAPSASSGDRRAAAHGHRCGEHERACGEPPPPPPPPPPHPRASPAASQLATRVVTFAMNLMIARKLSPEAYGVSRAGCAPRPAGPAPVVGRSCLLPPPLPRQPAAESAPPAPTTPPLPCRPCSWRRCSSTCCSPPYSC